MIPSQTTYLTSQSRYSPNNLESTCDGLMLLAIAEILHTFILPCPSCISTRWTRLLREVDETPPFPPPPQVKQNCFNSLHSTNVHISNIVKIKKYNNHSCRFKFIWHSGTILDRWINFKRNFCRVEELSMRVGRSFGVVLVFGFYFYYSFFFGRRILRDNQSDTTMML